MHTGTPYLSVSPFPSQYPSHLSCRSFPFYTYFFHSCSLHLSFHTFMYTCPPHLSYTFSLHMILHILHIFLSPYIFSTPVLFTFLPYLPCTPANITTFRRTFLFLHISLSISPSHLFPSPNIPSSSVFVSFHPSSSSTSASTPASPLPLLPPPDR